MRLRTALLVLCFLLTACGGQEAGSGGGSSPAGEGGGAVTSTEGVATIDLSAGRKKPEVTFTYGDSVAEAGIGTRCWNNSCVDTVGPPTPEVFTPVPGDLEIEFTGAGVPGSLDVGTPPKEDFGEPENSRRIELQNNHATLNLDPGRYMLLVFAVWDEGSDAVLSFGVEVG
jgi:hypothetical protein